MNGHDNNKNSRLKSEQRLEIRHVAHAILAFLGTNNGSPIYRMGRTCKTLGYVLHVSAGQPFCVRIISL